MGYLEKGTSVPRELRFIDTESRMVAARGKGKRGDEEY